MRSAALALRHASASQRVKGKNRISSRFVNPSSDEIIVKMISGHWSSFRCISVSHSSMLGGQNEIIDSSHLMYVGASRIVPGTSFAPQNPSVTFIHQFCALHQVRRLSSITEGADNKDDSIQETTKNLQSQIQALLRDQGNSAVETETYNQVLRNLAEICRRKNEEEYEGSEQNDFVRSAPSMAEELIQYMHQSSSATPSSQSYLYAIQIFVQSKDPTDLDTAIDYLHQLQILTEVNDYDSDSDLQVTSDHYNVILRELAEKSRRNTLLDAPHRAQVLLNDMEKVATTHEVVKPTTATYNSVIEAWKNSGDKKMAATRAQEVFDRMAGKGIQPDNATLSLMIHVWSTSSRRDAAFNATGHLLTLEKQYLKQEEEIKQIPEEEQNFQRQQFRLSLNDYTSVLQAWAHSRETHKAAKRASTILRKMRQWYERSLSPFEPSMVCYKAVLTAWKNSAKDDHRYGDAAVHAEEIMSHLLDRYDQGQEDMEPDTECFTMVLSMMARSSKQGTAAKAQYFLQRMEELSEKTTKASMHVRPSWVNYTDVIKAYAISKDEDATQNAEKVLLRMATI